MMVSVWFNNDGYQQAMIISFAYLLQFAAFVLYTLALTLTIEDAQNKLQGLESRLKTLLGKITRSLDIQDKLFLGGNFYSIFIFRVFLNP